MSVEDQIVKLKSDIELIHRKRMATEAELNALEAEKNAILAECQSLQIPEPKEIGVYIQTLETEMQKQLGVAEELFKRVG